MKPVSNGRAYVRARPAAGVSRTQPYEATACNADTALTEHEGALKISTRSRHVQGSPWRSALQILMMPYNLLWEELLPITTWYPVSLVSRLLSSWSLGNGSFGASDECLHGCWILEQSCAPQNCCQRGTMYPVHPASQPRCARRCPMSLLHMRAHHRDHRRHSTHRRPLAPRCQLPLSPPHCQVPRLVATLRALPGQVPLSCPTQSARRCRLAYRPQSSTPPAPDFPCDSQEGLQEEEQAKHLVC